MQEQQNSILVKIQQNNMSYISKVFSPKVNHTRINSEKIAKVIPPTNFENSIMEQNAANQVVTRSQGPSDVDLNNIGDPPSRVRSRKKTDTDGSKTSTVNFVIYIPMVCKLLHSLNQLPTRGIWLQ